MVYLSLGNSKFISGKWSIYPWKMVHSGPGASLGHPRPAGASLGQPRPPQASLGQPGPARAGQYMYSGQAACLAGSQDFLRIAMSRPGLSEAIPGCLSGKVVHLSLGNSSFISG